MTTKNVVDTHGLVWHLEGNPRLGGNARAILADTSSQLVLPIIALAEACWMVEGGKSSIPSTAALLAAINADKRVTIMPLSRIILERSLGLTVIPEMHDRLIVATALTISEAGETAVLLTKDGMIRRSGLVPVIW